MRLTPEELSRGVISWESGEPLVVRTRTASEGEEPTGWSDWLTESTGSVVQSAQGRMRQLSLRNPTGGAFVPPNQLRWEQEMDDEVVTWVYSKQIDAPPEFLRRMLRGPFSHRLVIATPVLSWSTDFILREPGLLVRFVEGKLIGEKTDPISEIEIHEGGQVSLVSSPMGEHEAQGKFVEIIVTGDSADSAESRAFSVLGLVGLCLGALKSGFGESNRS